MTIASEISRITGLRNRIRTKLVSIGLLQGGDRALNDLAACTTAIEGIGGTQNITTLNTYDVAAKDKAKVVDSNLVPGNIVSGVSILGVVGTASVSPPAARLQERTVLYGGENAPNTLVPSSGYDGISKVNFERTDANPTLVAANIRNGVKIMGVTGTYGQLQSKNVALGAAMPSTVSPATGYTGLSQVTFTKDTSVVKADNIKNGVQILGVTGSYETPTESKSVLLGADYPPAAVTPSAGKHLSSVTFSMNSNLFKAENIKAGVTLLGVTGTYSGSIVAYDNDVYDEILNQGNGDVEALRFDLPTTLTNENQIFMFEICNWGNQNLGATRIISAVFYRDVHGTASGKCKMTTADSTLGNSVNVFNGLSVSWWITQEGKLYVSYVGTGNRFYFMKRRDSSEERIYRLKLYYNPQS